MQPELDGQGRPWPAGRELLYVVAVDESAAHGGLVLSVFHRDRLRDGSWSRPKPASVDRQLLTLLPDAGDRRVLGLLAGAGHPAYPWMMSYARHGVASAQYLLHSAVLDALIPIVCATGRCRIGSIARPEEWREVRWDGGGGPWRFELEVRSDEVARERVVTGQLRRHGDRLDVAAPLILVAGGLLVHEQRFMPLDDGGAFPWILQLRQHGPLRVPFARGEELLDRLCRLPRLPVIALPDSLRFEEVVSSPLPRVRVRPGPREWGPKRLLAELSFDYDGCEVSAHQPGAAVLDRRSRRLHRRDADAESAAAARLGALGFRPRSLWGRQGYQVALDLAPRNLPRAVAELVRAGWRVEADGKLYRQPGALDIAVTSGVDWFELHGALEFGDTAGGVPPRPPRPRAPARAVDEARRAAPPALRGP